MRKGARNASCTPRARGLAAQHHRAPDPNPAGMTEIQSQPLGVSESSISSPGFDKDALVIRLDELLKKYLNTLDEYQKAREQLSKQLSSVSNLCFVHV